MLQPYSWGRYGWLYHERAGRDCSQVILFQFTPFKRGIGSFGSGGEVARNDIFNVRIKVVGQDRKGLLKDLTESISKLNINLTSVDIKVKEAVATAIFILQVNNLKQLDRVVRIMSKIKNIDSAERSQH